MPAPVIPIGMNARLFPSNWRPAREEIAFTRDVGFDVIQFPGPEQGLDAERLGDTLESVGAALRAAGVGAVMEMLLRIEPDGRTAGGRTLFEALTQNLPAITTLGCRCVHWHLVLASVAESDVDQLEIVVRPQLQAAVERAQQLGFRFGLEHNTPGPHPFASLPRCEAALSAVPGLFQVCDLNHVSTQEQPGYLALAARTSMLHVSDTPLPQLNYHWPIGRGTVDFAGWFAPLLAGGFRGPAILEIGGLPQSGGYGQDTDTALVDSLARLTTILNAL